MQNCYSKIFGWMNWTRMKQSVRIKLNPGRVLKMTCYKSWTSNWQDLLALVNVICCASAMLLVKLVLQIYTWDVSRVLQLQLTAPNKSITLKKIELLAVLVGTRSPRFHEESLQVNITEQILWADSDWIKLNKMLSPFVQQERSFHRKDWL